MFDPRKYIETCTGIFCDTSFRRMIITEQKS